MTAWVLIWAIGGPSGFAIPGIASEKACLDLARAINLSAYAECVPYEAVQPPTIKPDPKDQK